jgi:hypothetical protein
MNPFEGRKGNKKIKNDSKIKMKARTAAVRYLTSLAWLAATSLLLLAS